MIPELPVANGFVIVAIATIPETNNIFVVGVIVAADANVGIVKLTCCKPETINVVGVNPPLKVVADKVPVSGIYDNDEFIFGAFVALVTAVPNVENKR
jgi:hypothetical protein